MMQIWNEIIENIHIQKQNCSLIKELKTITLKSEDSHIVSFGTSGWRAIIGQEFTIYMVQKLTDSIVKLYQKEDGNLSSYGIISFQDLQKKGVILGHDNRLFALEFSLAVHTVLNRYSIPVFYAGEATVPELSAAVVQNDYAASVNLTPSHNPAPYGGYKFNTKDGGPAEEQVTQRISQICNTSSFESFTMLSEPKWKEVNCIEIYRKFVQDRGVLDLDFCIDETKKNNIALAVDPFYGSSKNQIFELLNRPLNLKRFHTEQDYFFNGKEPEPNSKNLEDLKQYLDIQPQKLKVGGIMDPDGDRVLLYDGHQIIPMNQFGAIAFHYFKKHLKKEGGVAKSVATSHFVNAVSNYLNSPCYETQIGFKNFRPFLKAESNQKALICFEESDGISAYNHTKEKDALFGFLLAFEITARLQKPLSQYLREIQEEVGIFYPLRKGLEITSKQMSSVKNQIKELVKKYSLDTSFIIEGETLKVIDLDQTDGSKWILNDGSWFLIRPSGTEPKIRIYVESCIQGRSEALFEMIRQWF